ncbi:VWA-like domain-containing protein [Streptomyces sp. NBC_01795]|nr:MULTISPECIES: VWA-like domain-containing protein [unclassified Streptomyces]WSA90664.1 VWA-like domain-containing protein [Streptomyces sp. NBC_01795]WSB74989.1 VWA-like domain-containing protein [Streptomyces sp. NBC_01775]WSS16731.1 VWA-like domain-containing protein [Streptomyces sp. NBC_01186]
MTGPAKRPGPRPLPRPMSRPAPPRPVRAAVPRPLSGSDGRAGRSGLPLDMEKLLAARLHAVKVRPYLADALFALHVVEDRSVPTMAVDAHWRCYVSPGFVARTPVEELAGVWVHEVSHLLRDHHGRGERYARAHEEHGPGEGGVPPGEGGGRLRRNIAADFEINDDIYGDGLPQPEGAVLPSLLRLPDGLLMEEYLRTASMSGLAADLAWLDCGSGADGQVRPWELGPDGAHGLSRQQRDAVRFRVAEGIKGRPGDAPEGWRRWADEAFRPPQPWRQLLGAAIRSAASAPGVGEDHSYRRPSRRSAGVPGVLLPSLRRTPPRVCVVIDTSGSVSDAELGSALLEVAAISRTVGGRRDLVSVISCDAAAGVAVPLCRAENIELVGGGGTDLRSGFARALRSGPRPDVIVALTDGQTPWPSAQPPCRTVVGLFPRPTRAADEENPDYVPDTPPPWARVVTIS